MRRQLAIGPVTIEVVRGDIAEQPDVDAVVNAANAELKPGGGVAGALHAAAGPELERAARPFAPLSPGEAAITPAFDLPNRFVIHCLGPVYGADEPAEPLLVSCYREGLVLAEANEVVSIAFPLISAGAFGYPLHDAARVAVDTAVDLAPSLEVVRLVRFVAFQPAEARVLEEALSARAGHV
jgi:O-acetyl-ADP-ribose deacetylase